MDSVVMQNGGQAPVSFGSGASQASTSAQLLGEPWNEDAAGKQRSVPLPPSHSVPTSVYMAVYSSVPVLEMMVRGISVMRRRSDSYMNATQILKVAGVEKGKRSRILEKDITQSGLYERVQGGYGRYQGTWIPFDKARELSQTYGVEHLLAPLFNYTMPSYKGPDHEGPFNADATAAGPTALDKRRQRDFEDDTSVLEVDVHKRFRPAHSSSTDPFSSSTGRQSIPFAALNGTNTKLRRSKSPVNTHTFIGDDTSRYERYRNTLISLFPEAANIDSLALDRTDDFETDTPIDDHMHTALHWAASLGRVDLARALIQAGADTERGNDAGETPLIRSVLAINCEEAGVFSELLRLLGNSLWTTDDSNRTALHHCALLAAIKGRANAAQYYVECILEFIATRDDGNFKDLIDGMDINGDTALNIAARIGSRRLVRLLINSGADKTRSNKLGLRPGDFGVETDELAPTTADEITNSLKSQIPLAPAQKAQDITKQLVDLVQTLNADFEREIQTKTETLERVQIQLRSSTRELADNRRQAQYWREQCAELERVTNRLKNLERASFDEDHFDWTGRTELNGLPSQSVPGAGYAFSPRPPVQLPADLNVSAEIDLPLGQSAHDLVRLRRMRQWLARVLSLQRQRQEQTRGINANLEVQYRRVVAAYCGMEESRLDEILDRLLVAMESDGNDLDLVRMSTFLGKAKGI
ncbi:uncharacterized protein L969DRAFT_96750 [Mixia osmundae IAM 14324]|uniref:HTH APSES-type domain-containing protein n=1 Tax=Mixia osmundae (strain CBS 9802 / IAM 14324 / JCM 22182 / KY 12970) TaxID=764103 RepID=G7DZL8_MIXOS|nr:uncharacterized protein L969DRAFT_96750 [Mixia osmundae IAM 14324]KEI37190.1 hypothetical protein L969DRAFT_96750 [Mixia osmundae IAM 14324]GAA96028.1 hypothetical protein E5Q_02688 [Mixia osmundae IAM 14324]